MTAYYMGATTMLQARWTITELVRDSKPWPLKEPVRDVEALCRDVVRRAIKALPRDQNGPGAGGAMKLTSSEFDEALAFCIGQVHVLLPAYDLARERNGSRLAGWLSAELRWDLLDYWRSPAGFGRHGQHRLHDGDPGVREVDEPDTESAGDRTDDWASPLVGLLQSGDRQVARQERILGLRTGRRAAAGARGGGAGAVGRVGGPVAGPVGGAGRSVPWVDCGGCGWRTFPQAPNGVDRWHYPTTCLGCGSRLGV